MGKYFEIPENLTIGFQNRSTLTNNLAFITYKDEKGNLKFEKSFNGWINKNIPILECKNEVITKLRVGSTAGGYKSGWNYRQEYIQLSTDDFTFEIRTDNFIDLLMYGTCSFGVLTGSFRFGWFGRSLVLLATNSEAYKSSAVINELKDSQLITKISQLEQGYWYKIKNYNKRCIFIGSMGIPSPDFKSVSKPFFMAEGNEDRIFFTDIKSVVCKYTNIDPITKSKVDEYRERFEMTPYSVKFWKENRLKIDSITPIKNEEGPELTIYGGIFDRHGNVYTLRPTNDDFQHISYRAYYGGDGKRLKPSRSKDTLFFKWFSLKESPTIQIPYRMGESIYVYSYKRYNPFGLEDYGKAVLRSLGDYKDWNVWETVWEYMSTIGIFKDPSTLYNDIEYTIGQYKYQMNGVLKYGFLFGKGPITSSGTQLKLATKIEN